MWTSDLISPIGVLEMLVCTRMWPLTAQNGQVGIDWQAKSFALRRKIQ
jgi:hypothetical protein